MKPAEIAFACFALLALIVIAAFTIRGCSQAYRADSEIDTIAVSFADSARIASDAARSHVERAELIADTLELVNIENEHLGLIAQIATRRVGELESSARARDRTAQALIESLHERSTAADTAAVLRGCTEARIGLGRALDACLPALDSVWVYAHGLEASNALHERKDVEEAAASGFQLIAYDRIETAYDLRSVQVVGLQSANRRLSYERYLYGLVGAAIGYGGAKLTGL